MHGDGLLFCGFLRSLLLNRCGSGFLLPGDRRSQRLGNKAHPIFTILRMKKGLKPKLKPFLHMNFREIRIYK